MDALTLSQPSPELLLPPEAARRLATLVAGYTGGYALPQGFYVDDGVFEADLERVFAGNWLFAGVTSDVPQPGDSLTWTVGRESVLLVRDTDGDVRAYHNVCRHPAASAIEPQLRPHRLDGTRVATRLHYRVGANWKTLVENNRECYHCRANHPEFCLSNFDLGVAGDSRRNRGYEAALAAQHRRWTDLGLSPTATSFPGGAFFRVARLPLRDGYVTESLSGRLVAPLLGDLPSAEVGSLRVITLPNAWIHANADYAMTTRLTPISPGVTDVDITFLVRHDAVESQDYDLDELTAVWVATSEQDWDLCERNYAGVRSRGYLPGPLSSVTEGSVRTFHDWYLTALTGVAGSA